MCVFMNLFVNVIDVFFEEGDVVVLIFWFVMKFDGG